jgi:hypothetical protein
MNEEKPDSQHPVPVPVPVPVQWYRKEWVLWSIVAGVVVIVSIALLMKEHSQTTPAAPPQMKEKP